MKLTLTLRRSDDEDEDEGKGERQWDTSREKDKRSSMPTGSSSSLVKRKEERKRGGQLVSNDASQLDCDSPCTSSWASSTSDPHHQAPELSSTSPSRVPCTKPNPEPVRRQRRTFLSSRVKRNEVSPPITKHMLHHLDDSLLPLVVGSSVSGSSEVPSDSVLVLSSVEEVPGRGRSEAGVEEGETFFESERGRGSVEDL